MAQVNTGALASQLQDIGFSRAGAWQLITGGIVTDAKDRQRLALVLAGLVEARSLRPSESGGRSTIQTASGIVIELQDDSGGGQGTTTGLSSSRRKTLTTARTRSGLRVSFEEG
jgi:hypothetical protein